MSTSNRLGWRRAEWRSENLSHKNVAIGDSRWRCRLSCTVQRRNSKALFFSFLSFPFPFVDMMLSCC